MSEGNEEEMRMEEAYKATPRPFVSAALGLVDKTTHVTVTDIDIPFGTVFRLVFQVTLCSAAIALAVVIVLGFSGWLG